MVERRGPWRRVVEVLPRVDDKEWQCTLECGHTVMRPMKRRWVKHSENSSIEVHKVTEPRWVYCEECACNEET